MCAGCEAWNESIEIRSPETYRNTMHAISRDIAAGKLREHGDIPSIVEIVQNWPLQNGDWIDRRLNCPLCQQTFAIFVESYHGRGGSWRAIAQGQ